jgi:L-ascorbate metabolism protein UlaG (beta-lactamase superfamily)
MTARVVDPQRLDFVDVVTSSHNHTDHLDPETIGPVVDASPDVAVVAPAANLDLVSKRSCREVEQLIGIDDGASVTVGDFEIHGIAAAHDELSTDDAGRHHFLGYVIQFGEWTIYHSGDTRPYDGLIERLSPFKIDLAMLPINGSASQRRVTGNFWGHEAARVAKDAGVRIVVPCHYDMFSFNTATPDAFVHSCWKLDQPYRVLRAGERWTSVELGIGEG